MFFLTCQTNITEYSRTCIKGSPSGNDYVSDRSIEVDHLIQVVQNTGQNTVKMPLHITVNDIVYSLCIKALKKITYSVKSNCNNKHGLRKIEHREGVTKQ